MEKQSEHFFTAYLRGIAGIKKGSTLQTNEAEFSYEWNMKNGAIEWFGNFAEQLGYERDTFVQEFQAWEKIIHPGDRMRVKNRMGLHLKADVPFCERYLVYHKNGKLLNIEDTGTYLMDNAHSPYKWIGVMKILKCDTD